MTSLNSNGGGPTLFRNSGTVFPNLADDWSFCCWVKIESYGGGSAGQGVICMMDGGGAVGVELRTGDGTIGASGALVLHWFENGASEHTTQAVSTGSSTAWIFVGATHTEGANTITVYWRLEGASSLSSASLSAPDAATAVGSFPSTGLAVLFEGSTGNKHPDANLYSFKAFSANIGGTRMLDESASPTALDDSTNAFCFLDLDSTTNPGDDLHTTANDFDAFDTLLQEATTPNAAIGGAFTLTASAGSFALTGVATGLVAQRKLTADTRTYALTGVAAGLNRGYPLPTSTGVFALNGTATGLTAARRLTAATGTFSLNGTAAGLNRGYRLTADPASFTLTGVDAALTHGSAAANEIDADVGSFTLTGNAAALLAGRRLTAEAGSFTETGNAAALNRGYPLLATAVAFNLTGITAGLTAQRRLTAEASAILLNGINAGLLYSGAPADTDSFQPVIRRSGSRRGVR